MISAEISDPAAHAPVETASCPAIGGSSHWWGGRAVPLDPVDFAPRPDRPDWPFSYDDLMPWWEEAARFLGSHGLERSPPPGAFAHLPRHDAAQSESWGPELNMARRWRDRIAATDGPVIVPGARVVGFETEHPRVTGLRVLVGGEIHTVQPRHVALACGGLGVMKLLLNAERAQPGLLAGAAHLGAGYM
ncbi:MAG: hypothetical protein AAFU66_06965, partial [Pseudomonadota bacterium]